jgi:hypothetical protein
MEKEETVAHSHDTHGHGAVVDRSAPLGALVAVVAILVLAVIAFAVLWTEPWEDDGGSPSTPGITDDSAPSVPDVDPGNGGGAPGDDGGNDGGTGGGGEPQPAP